MGLAVNKVNRRTLIGLGGALALGTVASPLLAACQPQVVEKPVEVTKVVEKQVLVTQVVEKQVTQVVEKPVEKVVTQVVEREKVVTAAPSGRTSVQLRFPNWAQPILAVYIGRTNEKTGILVKNEPWAGQEKVLTELAAGVGPDIFQIDSYFYGEFFPRKVLADLLPYYRALNIDSKRWATDPMKVNVYNGELMGLDTAVDYDWGMWINMKLAREAGVDKDLPLWGTPRYDQWKMTDFFEWVRKATKKGADGKAQYYGWHPSLGQWTWGDAENAIVQSNRGKIFPDPWDYRPKETTINSPEVVGALQPIVELMRGGFAPSYETFAAGSSGGGEWMFRAGKVLAQGRPILPQIFQDLRQKGDWDLQVIAHPWYQVRSHILQPGVNSVNRASKYRDLAAEWVMTFSTDFEVQDGRPLHWSTPAYDTMKHLEKVKPGFDRDLLLMNMARVKGVSTKPELAQEVWEYPRHMGAKSLFFQRTTKKYVQQIMSLKLDVQEGMNQAKTEVDAEFAKGYQY